MVYIGIDPGKKGAMAMLSNDGDPLIIPFDPSAYIDALWKLKCEDEPCICCIEQVHSVAKQGLSSTWSFGVSYGWLLGMLDSIGIPYQPISPQKWKNEFGLNSDKAISVEVCKRLFPSANLMRTERSRKDDDGCAEALLMACYAKRKF